MSQTKVKTSDMRQRPFLLDLNVFFTCTAPDVDEVVGAPSLSTLGRSLSFNKSPRYSSKKEVLGEAPLARVVKRMALDTDDIEAAPRFSIRERRSSARLSSLSSSPSAATGATCSWLEQFPVRITLIKF
jgi:hypothetical protein